MTFTKLQDRQYRFLYSCQAVNAPAVVENALLGAALGDLLLLLLFDLGGLRLDLAGTGERSVN